MDTNIPKCPHCQDGGSVTRISEKISENALAPLPGYIRKTEMFACVCGWTLVRTLGPRKDEAPYVN